MDARLRLLESALQSAYEAQDTDLVFSLCHAIAEQINQQSYQDGQAKLESAKNWMNPSNSTSEDLAA